MANFFLNREYAKKKFQVGKEKNSWLHMPTEYLNEEKLDFFSLFSLFSLTWA